MSINGLRALFWTLVTSASFWLVAFLVAVLLLSGGE